MKYLALDIGKRRTGVAFGDSLIGIPFPLPTMHHTSMRSLFEQVLPIIQARSIDEVIVGYPLLLSGKPGSQVSFVERYIKKFKDLGIKCSSIDERYTSPKTHPEWSHAFAACAILDTKFMLEK